MLTKRQNLVEVMKGGKPDRFVKQYEAFAMMMKTPITRIKPPVGGEIVNEWKEFCINKGNTNVELGLKYLEKIS